MMIETGSGGNHSRILIHPLTLFSTFKIHLFNVALLPVPRALLFLEPKYRMSLTYFQYY
jgi:hypothetical protein